MVSARISALPVVQDTRLIGLVTETDLLRILSDVMPNGRTESGRSRHELGDLDHGHSRERQIGAGTRGERGVPRARVSLRILELDQIRRTPTPAAAPHRLRAGCGVPGARLDGHAADGSPCPRHHRRDRPPPCVAGSGPRRHLALRRGPDRVPAGGRPGTRAQPLGQQCPTRHLWARRPARRHRTRRQRAVRARPRAGAGHRLGPGVRRRGGASHRGSGCSVRGGTEGPALGTAGWAIWITGRPGTGKTTVASRLVEALATREVPVRVLDLDETRRHLVPGRRVSDAEQEILHRTLAYATKLLTEAGTAVIIDAAAPRRAWRQTARELVPCFAEIYLVCPVALCVDRERAARWGLGGKAPVLPPPTGRRRARHHPGLRGVPPAGAHRPYRRRRPFDGRTEDPVPGPATAPIARDGAQNAVNRRPRSTAGDQPTGNRSAQSTSRNPERSRSRQPPDDRRLPGAAERLVDREGAS